MTDYGQKTTTTSLLSEMVGKPLNCIRIEHSRTRLGRETFWNAFVDYDEVPGGVPVRCYDNHLVDIDVAFCYDPGTMQKRLRSGIQEFTHPLVIYALLDKKRTVLKLDWLPLQLCDNPAIAWALVIEFWEFRFVLNQILGVVKITDYDNEIQTARKTVNQWIENNNERLER